MLVLLALNFAVSYVVYRILVTDANFRDVAEAKVQWDAAARGQTLAPEAEDRAVDALMQQRKRWYFIPPFAVLASTLGISVFFYLLLWAVRAQTTFPKVFSVVCWSFLIYRVLGGIVTIAALLIRGPTNFSPAPPEAWSPTSLAHFVSRMAVSPNVYSAISKLDIFLVWWLAVLVIGLSKIARNLSIRKSAVLVVASEAVYLVLNAFGFLP